MSNRLFMVLIALLYIITGPVYAIGEVTFDGFLTVGAAKSDSRVDSEDGNIADNAGFEEDTRVGIQFSTDINSDMGLTVQLIGKGRDGAYDASFDWGYVDYRVNDNLAIRAGKLKLPTFLISDYYEVGYAYPWVRPPQEVYSSNPITAISGVDLLFRTTIGSADFLFQPYFGTSKGEEALVPQEALGMYDAAFGTSYAGTNTAVYTEFDADNFIGFNASIGNDKVTVRAGYLETEVSVASFGVTDENVSFASMGVTADWNNYVVYSEYFEREINGAANTAFPNQQGWYATFGYRIDKFLPLVTFARMKDNSNPVLSAQCGGNPCGTPLDQQSITLGLRYELGTGAALKFETQQIEPAAGTRGLFMNNTVGSDVNVTSISLDVVF